jgi:hypothetical protein
VDNKVEREGCRCGCKSDCVVFFCFSVVCSNFFFVDFMRFVGGLSVSGNKRA